MNSSHRIDGRRSGVKPCLHGWSRIMGVCLLVGLMAFVGCQTQQMRDLRKMGVMPEDLSDRIAREGETPVGYSNHVPPAEEKPVAPKKPIGILNRGQEPDQTPPNSPPPLPSGRNEGPPPIVVPKTEAKGSTGVLIQPEGLGAAQIVTPGVPPKTTNPTEGILNKTSIEATKAGMAKPSIFDVPTLKERATQLGRKHTGSRVVATVNGQAILEEEINLAMMMSAGGGEDPTEGGRRKQILNTLIDREISIWDAETKLGKIPQGKKFLEKLREYGTREYDRLLRNLKEKNNFESIDEMKVKLKAEGMPLELMKRQTERNFVAMQYLQQRVMPMTDRIGHQDLKEYYQQHAEMFTIPEAIQWRDIFIAKAKFNTPEEAQKQAEMVAQKARNGEDWVKLSKTYCHGESALRDGEGAGAKPGEIRPPEAEPIILSLKDGEMAPILELKHGYHIILLVKRQKGGKRPFDETVQREIRERLKNEIANLEMKRLLTEMKRNAVIEMMPEQ